MRIAGAEELRAKLDKNQTLLTATIEVTRRCNLRCVHCLRPVGHDDGLTYAVVCSTIDQLAALGCMTMTLTGGEPLVRRDLLDIVAYAWAKRFAVTIMTNGTLVTGEVAAELKRSHVSELQVSVYGADPKVHDAVTQAPGSHERTLRGIALAREHGLKVRVAMPLLASNAGQSPAVESWCREQGLAFLQGALIFPRNDGNRYPLTLLASSEQMALVIKQEDASVRDQPVPAATASDGVPLCSAGRDRLAVGADGSVYPCDAWRVPLGNVHSDGLADVWFGSPQLSAMRAQRRRHPAECTGCRSQGQCVWCPGLSFELLGDASRPSAQDCRRTRLSLASLVHAEPAWSLPAALQLP
jgi:radical SAM protein with 4Fe4S-binding SPASM domain